ncbi:MAG: histidinol-phosphatase [Acetatifactor sp.]|jgi:histidinol-phosphatase (PHP family)|nr:histidinol-phosphatase [Acetatifactor sp.]
MNEQLKEIINDRNYRKSNFHTHTPRCRHAEGSEREYIESAIENGYEILGFSDHAPLIFEDGYVSGMRMEMREFEGYVRTLEKLRDEYKGDIDLYIGLEMEYFPARFQKSMDEILKYPLDYMILGQHYYDDEYGYRSPGRQTENEADIIHYVERIIEGLDTGLFLYVAHPDFIHYVGPTEIYDKHMNRMLEEFKRRNMPVELNLNGFRDPRHYPNKRFIELGVKNGNSFVMGVDAHRPKELGDEELMRKLAGLVFAQGGVVLNRENI